jgi:hypothetical protein
MERFALGDQQAFAIARRILATHQLKLVAVARWLVGEVETPTPSSGAHPKADPTRRATRLTAISD